MKRLSLIVLVVVLLTACSSQPDDPNLIFTTKGLPKAKAELDQVISQIELREDDDQSLLLELTFAQPDRALTLEEQAAHLQLVEWPRGDEATPSRLVLRLPETDLAFQPKELTTVEHPLVKQVSFATVEGRPAVLFDFHTQVDLQPTVGALRVTPCPGWSCRDVSQLHLFKQPPIIVSSADEAALYLPEPIATPTYLPGGHTLPGFLVEEATGRVYTAVLTEAGLTEIFQELRPAAYLDLTPYPRPAQLSSAWTVQHGTNLNGDDVWVLSSRFGELYISVTSTLPLEEAMLVAEGLQ